MERDESTSDESAPPASSSSGAPQARVERFRPTSGLFTGAFLVVVGFALAVLAALDRGVSVPVAAAAVFLAVLAWATTLWPRISVVGDRLVLRNTLRTTTIPLAAVEELLVRQVLVVEVGDATYTSPALGRSRRALVGRSREPAPTSPHPTEVPGGYAGYVEHRLRLHLDEARAASGLRMGSPEHLALAAQVRRTTHWPVVAALVATFASFVASLVI